MRHPKEVARSTPFDNSSNGFTASDVQEAIEELDDLVETGFGSNFQYAESLDISSTTSTTTYSTKVTLTPSVSLPSGDYVLFYKCVHDTNAANRETDIRIRRGSTTLFEIRDSMIRSQGDRLISGFVHLSSISGTDAFTLEFKVGGTATTSNVREARLMLWRVA